MVIDTRTFFGNNCTSLLSHTILKIQPAMLQTTASLF